MNTDEQPLVAPQQDVQAASQKQDDEAITPEKIEKKFKSRIEGAKRNRRNMYTEWKRNVEIRLGKVASIFTGGVAVEDEVQSEINPDWSLTKTKTANLYSQMPTVQLQHENKQYAAALPGFAKSLNYEIGEKRANIAVAMEEVLNDVVNAAGIGAVWCGYAARFQDKEIPAIDTSMIPPQQLQQLMATKQIPTRTVPEVVSDMFFGNRISPVDLLWPAEFTGSDFDNGDFIGHTDRMPRAVAKVEFKLSDEDLDKADGGNDNPTQDDLRNEPERGGIRAAESGNVKYDELFYWRYRVDPEEKNFKAIWRIVYINGMDRAVIHEPWKGQAVDPQTHKIVGATKFPIRVLTLTYVTDNPVPPSDSSAARPQVNDLRRSRSQMFKNRDRSIPVRWYDVNRVDPAIADTLMRGTWQGMIPSNGPGDKSFGEMARASYPPEDNSFDQTTKADLMDMWQIGPNQMGTTAPGKHSSAEANMVQQNFATRIGQERARVAYFFLSICEVISGLMVLYSEFPVLTPQEKQQMQQAWDDKHIIHDLVMKIRPDSTIVLDTQARLQRLSQFLNMTVKSGFVNPMPIIVEMAELSGLDPADVIVQPKPKEPEEPQLSYRFTGKDDLINPVVMAMLVKHKRAPTPEELNEAKQILEAAQLPSHPTPAPQGAGAPGAPGPHPPGPGGPPAGPVGPSNPLEDAHPHWSIANKVAKRSRDMGGGNT